MLLCAPQKLVVSLVPAGEVHPELWKGANRKFARVPWRKIELERHNAERTPEQQARRRPWPAWAARASAPAQGRNQRSRAARCAAGRPAREALRKGSSESTSTSVAAAARAVAAEPDWSAPL